MTDIEALENAIEILPNIKMSDTPSVNTLIDNTVKELNNLKAVLLRYRESPNVILCNKCSICGEPQFNTPSGITCVNGHGGADSV